MSSAPAPAGGEAGTISGIRAFHGEGAAPAQGFWAEAWGRVIRRPRAIVALAWLSIVAFFAAFAPLIASGHPWRYREITPGGERSAWTSPLIDHLGATDWLLMLGVFIAIPLLALPMKKCSRGARLGLLLAAGAQAGVTVAAAAWVASWVKNPDASDAVRVMEQSPAFIPSATAVVTIGAALLFACVTSTKRFASRALLVGITGAISGAVVFGTWRSPLEVFLYRDEVAASRAEAHFTLIPFSPNQRRGDLDLLPPGTTLTAEGEAVRAGDEQHSLTRESLSAVFHLGTDSLGQDVLSQMLHACRLSISIGLVSTSIAVLIGVSIGALMGYFGGVVDLVLYRVVEIFMAVPVLFLLIVAASVLPRNTYVMMVIIGCFTWTGAARYTRAEFMRLRGQDFVAGAKALGLPLRSILFRHMLPNGVTPVLVDASFAIAAAVLVEATLSYLGLGPEGQPSWGRLLSDATSSVGDFVWWLAVFPAVAIFLTVLSYNMLGESLRDAIDPKRRGR